MQSLLKLRYLSARRRRRCTVRIDHYVKSLQLSRRFAEQLSPIDRPGLGGAVTQPPGKGAVLTMRRLVWVAHG